MKENPHKGLGWQLIPKHSLRPTSHPQLRPDQRGPPDEGSTVSHRVFHNLNVVLKAVGLVRGGQGWVTPVAQTKVAFSCLRLGNVLNIKMLCTYALMLIECFDNEKFLAIHWLVNNSIDWSWIANNKQKKIENTVRAWILNIKIQNPFEIWMFLSTDLGWFSFRMIGGMLQLCL